MSSDCFSLPTMGATAVSMSARIMWMLGALAFRRTPYRPPCFMISGSSRVSSSMPGTTMP